MNIDSVRISILSITDDKKNKSYLYAGKHDKILKVIDQSELIDVGDPVALKAYNQNEYDKMVEKTGKPARRLINFPTVDISEYTKAELEEVLGFKLPNK